MPSLSLFPLWKPNAANSWGLPISPKSLATSKHGHRDVSATGQGSAVLCRLLVAFRRSYGNQVIDANPWPKLPPLLGRAKEMHHGAKLHGIHEMAVCQHSTGLPLAADPDAVHHVTIDSQKETVDVDDYFGLLC